MLWGQNPLEAPIRPFAHKLARTLLLGAMLSLSGCKDAKPPKAERDRPSLLESGEVEAMRKTLSAIAKENASKSCLRPLLQPELSRPGKADADMLAMLSRDGEMGRCYEAVEAIKAESGDELFLRLPEIEARANETGLSIELDKARQAIARVQSACKNMSAPLARAVSHEDSCSPYLPGRLGLGEMMPFLFFSRAAVWVSRDLAAQGRNFEAVMLLLRVLRYGQDLSRGGTSLLLPMLAYASKNHVHPEISRLLPALSTEQLRDAKKQLSILISTHPHYTEYFLGERNTIAIESAWPLVEEDDWAPPGGWAYGSTAADVTKAEEGGPTAEEHAVLLWETIDQNANAQMELCPLSMTLRDCNAALDTRLDRLAAVAKPDLAKLFQSAQLSSEDARKEVRKAFMDILRAMSADLTKYLIRIEATRLSLVAQVTHAESLLAARSGQPCPAAQAADPEESKLQVTEKDGYVELSLPTWLIEQDEARNANSKIALPLVRFRCAPPPR